MFKANDGVADKAPATEAEKKARLESKIKALFDKQVLPDDTAIWPSDKLTDQSPVEDVILSLYSEGAGDVEVYTALKMTEAAFNEKFDNDPDFRKLVAHGRDLSQSWWMRAGRRSLWSKTVNSNLYVWLASRRFPWLDKTKPEKQDKDENLTLEQMERELADILKKANKDEP